MAPTGSPLTDDERLQYERDGYLLRRSVMTAEEVDGLRRGCEEVCTRLAASSVEGGKVDVSQFYVFETDIERNVIIKWEPGHRRVIQGLEPLAHLEPVVAEIGQLPALTEPSRDLLGVDEVALFTEKLNLKRAGVGGAYALHRDLPYWIDDADEPYRTVTALVALDDASAASGALEVLPGSHLIDDPPFKESELEFERNELDPERLDTSGMVPVEMAAGDAVFFGPMLIHRSGANQTTVDRRTVLYTYQRAGLRDMRQINREWFEAHGGSSSS